MNGISWLRAKAKQKPADAPCDGACTLTVDNRGGRYTPPAQAAPREIPWNNPMRQHDACPCGVIYDECRCGT